MMYKQDGAKYFTSPLMNLYMLVNRTLVQIQENWCVL
jgi:hypothetical protein